MLASVEAAAAESLSEDALVHLKSYKYSSVDESYISNYILKHYWNACVEFLPMWLAPNMVTLLGFFCIISNVIFLVIWQPEMNGQEPSWIYYSFAFGLWAYSTMDNIDGKQARRTGTSSPLGELFDHGIDSLNCTLASLLETAAMGLGNSKAAMFTALVPCVPMFFSTWETYHTHTLYLGVINGPTEGLIIACMIMALAGHFGPAIWTQPLTDFFGTAFFPSSLSALTFRDVWVGIIILTLFGTQIPFCVLNVVRARRRDNLPVAPRMASVAALHADGGESPRAVLPDDGVCVRSDDDENHPRPPNAPALPLLDRDALAPRRRRHDLQPAHPRAPTADRGDGTAVPARLLRLRRRGILPLGIPGDQLHLRVPGDQLPDHPGDEAEGSGEGAETRRDE
ncbi:hypothetical protein V498_04998 [Pseudogymnoascus sp. VKM F-4517 (FW-2822)]|nr:hypothetical protein V498_04998 [Pseudogymnoascus sp. VKM F-4517 (FW-2822)]